MFVKIKFTDFWEDFNEFDNYFIDILSRKYKVINSNDPEILFFSNFGNMHLQYDCIKVYFTGENQVPNFNLCDFALGFHYIDFEDRYFRLPLYRLYEKSYNDKINQREIKKINLNSKGFCSYIQSANCADEIREVFFNKLNNYRPIDSGGRHLNNIGYQVKNKLDFIKNYKFNIAFENSFSKGYTSEKILDSFAANTIPVYWGNPLVYKDFNDKAFINVHDFSNLDAVIEFIKFLDKNDEEYKKILSQKIYHEQQENEFDELIISFFDNILLSNLNVERPYNYRKHQLINELKSVNKILDNKFYKLFFNTKRKIKSWRSNDKRNNCK